MESEAAKKASGDALGKLTPLASVRLAVKPGIEAKAVHAALDRIFELSGCTACGFNGILDFSILVINPESKFNIPGIVGIGGIRGG